MEGCGCVGICMHVPLLEHWHGGSPGLTRAIIDRAAFEAYLLEEW